jgi:hypothetical protein
MAQDAQLPQDGETRRLIAAREACRAKELAAADQLSKPRHSMLYSAYTRLPDALGAVRLRCNEITLAIKAHRQRSSPASDLARSDLPKKDGREVL